MTQPTAEQLEVTQVDRDAAEPFIGYHTYEHKLVHAFARHRQAAEARMAAAVEAETGWLIEVPANEHNPIIYYCGKGTYNADASKAVRFCRKQDAEAVMADMGTEKSIATEHRWG